MTANPIELIGGITTTDNVPKADIVAWAKARVPQVMANAAEVNNTTMGVQLVIYVKSLGAYFVLDTTDTTTADNGTTCLVSDDNKRFKIVSAIPAPTAVSLGGVYSKAAVTSQWLKSLGTDGTFTSTQPAASDLSNGVTGSGGAVVLATGPAIAGGTHDGLTSLGIRSTAAAYDIKFASAEVLTATRTLSLVMGDANRSITLAGNLSYGGAFTMSGAYGFTGTLTGSTGVTFPTAGTLATLAGTETLTNKGINASNNTVTNLTTAMFASNVVDTDGTLTANSDTRLASQKAVKTYVDTVAQGLDPKASVRAATTANITLSGAQTIDGVSIIAGDRVLVKNQSTTANNGIYLCASGSWTRTTDADAWAELPGAFVFVEEGTANGDSGWTCTVNAGGTLGSTSVTFTQFAGAGTYTAGTGLTLTGTVFAIDSTVTTLTGAQALTGKTYNGLTITTTTGSLTITNGKTATFSNTLTFSGTDSSNVAFGAGGTVLYNGGALGTPSSGTLTNGTGLPISTGLTGAGTGVLTALAVNVGSAGAPVVFNGALGTPSSGTLTNGTGLPISTGVSGLGTGIATALAVNVGSAGAPVLFNGAGGTPSSLTLANATGLPTAGMVDNSVTLAKMAQVATATFLGRTTASTGNVEALTATQATALLNAMVGDSGSGGTKGLVPAPASGDYAAGKFLDAGGFYSVPAGGGGGGGMTDTERQNSLIDRIYQSKVFGDVRRGVKTWATGFKASSDTLRGISAGSSSNYDTTNSSASGYVGPIVSPPTTSYVTGDRTASITVTTNIPIAGGTINNLVDGGTGSNGTDSVDHNGTSNADGNYYLFDFGSAKYIDEVKWYCVAGTPSNGTWLWQYSLDGSTGWTQIASVTWNTATQTMSLSGAPNAGARYYRFIKSGTSGAMANIYYAEVEFKSAAGSTAASSMTLVTIPQTSSSSVSNGRVLIEFDNTATPTLNTDLIAEVTCKLNTATITVTIASPGVVSHTAHGMSNGDPVSFTTSGALPTGIVSGTTYFVSGQTTNAYNLAATPGGTAINTTGSQSGTHTASNYIWTAATLSSATANGQAGHSIAETADASCTSGTSFAARIKTLNGKNVPIYGATVTVH